MLWFYVTYSAPHAPYLITQCSVSETLGAIGDVMRFMKQNKNFSIQSFRGRDFSFLNVIETEDGDADERDDGDAVGDASGGFNGRSSIKFHDGVDRKLAKDFLKERRVRFLRSLLRVASVSIPPPSCGGFTLPLNHHRQVCEIVCVIGSIKCHMNRFMYTFIGADKFNI